MYRIYDRAEAIRSVQRYLRIVGNPNVFVAPSGVYDENTRQSVIDFQERMLLEPTGMVDYHTFVKIYEEYLKYIMRAKVKEDAGAFASFPFLPGDMNEKLIHINRLARDIMNYYGFTNRIRDDSFYSEETARAVEILRSVYLLEKKEMIDEVLYSRMILDHASISRLNFING